MFFTIHSILDFTIVYLLSPGLLNFSSLYKAGRGIGYQQKENEEKGLQNTFDYIVDS